MDGFNRSFDSPRRSGRHECTIAMQADCITAQQLLAALPADVSHLRDSLEFRSALVQAISSRDGMRPQLLIALKTAGVTSLPGRQRAANAISKAHRLLSATRADAQNERYPARAKLGLRVSDGTVLVSVTSAVDLRFTMVGQRLDSLRDSLIRRGWHESEAPDALVSFKWTRKLSELGTAQPSWRILNHFRKTDELVTKQGLASNLRMLGSMAGVDVLSVAPPSFCLADGPQLHEFLAFKSLIRAHATLCAAAAAAAAAATVPAGTCSPSIAAASQVAERFLTSYEAALESPSAAATGAVSCAASAAAIAAGSAAASIASSAASSEMRARAQRWRARVASLRSLELTQRERDALLCRVAATDVRLPPAPLPEAPPPDGAQAAPTAAAPSATAIATVPAAAASTDSPPPSSPAQWLSLAERLCTSLQLPPPQEIQADEGEDAWILKSAAGRRGEGITIATALDQVLERCEAEQFRLVAQQYVRHPMLIQGRKFDIRMWALVTSFNPLVWWAWDDYYLRFATAPYTSASLGSKDYAAAHLTNHCVQEAVEGYGETIEANMWSRQQFIHHLANDETCSGNLSRAEVREAALRAKMNELLTTALTSVSDVVEQRSASFELFGFDVLLDDRQQPWLLEANSSPSMARDAAPLRRMVDKGLEDLVAVVIDLYHAQRPVTAVAATRAASPGPCWRLACSWDTSWSESELHARRFTKDVESGKSGGVTPPRTPQAVLRQWFPQA